MEPWANKIRHSFIFLYTDILHLVLIVYFQGMPSSKQNFKRKLQLEDYNKNYHLKRIYHSDKDTRILISHYDYATTNYQKKQIIFNNGLKY